MILSSEPRFLCRSGTSTRSWTGSRWSPSSSAFSASSSSSSSSPSSSAAPSAPQVIMRGGGKVVVRGCENSWPYFIDAYQIQNMNTYFWINDTFRTKEASWGTTYKRKPQHAGLWGHCHLVKPSMRCSWREENRLPLKKLTADFIS